MGFVISDRVWAAIAASRAVEAVEVERGGEDEHMQTWSTKKVPRNFDDDAQPLGLFLGPGIALVRNRLGLIR